MGRVGKWDLHMDSKLEEVRNDVYLTAEAEETLDSVEPGTYVIGGLLIVIGCRGVCKGSTIKHPKVTPLEHVHFKSRTVLCQPRFRDFDLRATQRKRLERSYRGSFTQTKNRLKRNKLILAMKNFDKTLSKSI